MTTKSHGLLQSLPIPSRPWTNVTMYFVVQLSNFEGHNAILVVVDRFMKVGHFAALKLGFTVVDVVFLNFMVKLHEFSLTIVTDRDPIFLSKFWCQLLTFNGFKLHYSTANHLQSDGLIKIVNYCLEQYIQVFTFHEPQLWYS